MFNALRYIQKLEAVGFPREQAEAQVQLVLDSIDAEVATKSDLSELRDDLAVVKGEIQTEFAEFKAEMKTEFSAFKTEMKTDFAAFKAEMKMEFAEFKAEMKMEFAEFKADVMVKLGAILVGSITLATTILGILIKS